MVRSLKGEVWQQTLRQLKYYWISNFGRIKCVEHWAPVCRKGKTYWRHAREHLLHPSSGPDGYLFIMCDIRGHHRICHIHRLVAEAFIPNPHHYPYVNHLNEDKTDNRASNLEWCTAKMNTNYGHAVMRARAGHEKPVKFIYHGKIKYFRHTLQAAIWVKNVKKLSQGVIRIARNIDNGYCHSNHTVYGMRLGKVKQRNWHAKKVSIFYGDRMKVVGSEAAAARWLKRKYLLPQSLPNLETNISRCCLKNQRGHHFHYIADNIVCRFRKDH